MSSTATLTPAMRQFMDAKRQFRDAIVFFRMGDFYEMFYEDALVASKALELTLTSRSKDADGGGIPMCGVPHHAADAYIARLVRKGFRVAICEQTEDPKKAKGLVKREVVRVVSPGTLTDAGYLEAREPTLLMALAVHAPSPQPIVGAAIIDVSTGECSAAEYRGAAAISGLSDELVVLRPREIVLSVEAELADVLPEVDRLRVPVTRVDGWTFGIDAARRVLRDQFRTHGLEGFGLEGHDAAIAAAGGLIAYLRDTQRADLAHVRSVRHRVAQDGLLVDAVTMKHLEVVVGAEGTAEGTLFSALDRTITSMGARVLRGWLLRPLGALEPIRDRLDAVEDLAYATTDRERCREALRGVHDLERLVGRVALGNAGPRDLVALKSSLRHVPRVKAALAACRAPLLTSLSTTLDEVPEVHEEIARALIDDPPALARDGGFTRDGFDAALDALKAVSRSGRDTIAAMEEAERARTGISSLKVRFNRVFGYYIEISKANLRSVPDDYQRKQTIAGGERFTTPALKEYEETVLGADERILARELEIFDALKSHIVAEAGRIQDTARALAAIDALAGLAETAVVSNFTKPHVHDGDEFVVVDGRHPVVERTAEAFVPNDIDLNGTTRQLVVLTGPNMGGKSTYLRQAALIPLMAQAGSFVPAREAKVPLVDRIFARVGASDNIARGHSTFMVEMQETANILHTATSKSLVVLDEIGRGTSTFDGLSLAWAVAEYLATHPTSRPKTLFATHYHELTDLADAVAGVVNAHVSAREWKDEIVFLRKIVPGRADRSYGIQVARLAGLPPPVIARAREILSGLERDELSRGGRPTLSGTPGAGNHQLGLFAAVEAPAPHPVLKALEKIDVDDLTPRRALDIIAELKDLASTQPTHGTNS